MNRYTPPLLGGLLVALLLAYTPQATADHPQLRTSAGYYDLFLGVVPAQRIAQYPDLVPHDHPIVSGANRYHLELAVIDRRTGQRVDDAEVRVAANALGLNARNLELNRMEMAGAVTYCGYVRLQPGDFYRFDVAIEREAWSAPLEATLDYGQVATN